MSTHPRPDFPPNVLALAARLDSLAEYEIKPVVLSLIGLAGHHPLISAALADAMGGRSNPITLPDGTTLDAEVGPPAPDYLDALTAVLDAFVIPEDATRATRTRATEHVRTAALLLFNDVDEQIAPELARNVVKFREGSRTVADLFAADLAKQVAKDGGYIDLTDYVTAAEAADLTGLGLETIATAIADGELAVRHVALIHRDGLFAWVEKLADRAAEAEELAASPIVDAGPTPDGEAEEPDDETHRALVTGVLGAIRDSQAVIAAELHDGHAVGDELVEALPEHGSVALADLDGDERPTRFGLYPTPTELVVLWNHYANELQTTHPNEAHEIRGYAIALKEALTHVRIVPADAIVLEQPKRTPFSHLGITDVRSGNGTVVITHRCDGHHHTYAMSPDQAREMAAHIALAAVDADAERGQG